MSLLAYHVMVQPKCQLFIYTKHAESLVSLLCCHRFECLSLLTRNSWRQLCVWLACEPVALGHALSSTESVSGMMQALDESSVWLVPCSETMS